MQSFTLEGTQGAQLHGFFIRPEKSIKRVLHILHGMGEHAARYEEFGNYLAKQGIAVYAHDHRAHGKSLVEGQSVGIFQGADSLETIVDDVECVQTYIRQLHPNSKMMILGHSMGSVILRRYLERTTHVFDRVVVMGSPPYYGLAYTKMMRLIGGLMAKRIPQTKRHEKLAAMLNDGLIKTVSGSTSPFDWLSHDEAVVAAYEADPACGYAYNAPFYLSFFKLLDCVNSRTCIQAQPLVPTMLISGAEDPLNPNDRTLTRLTIKYRQAHPHLSLETVSVAQARHEVLNELNKTATFTRLKGFLCE